MKNWLFSINVFLLFSFLLACPSKKSTSTNDTVEEIPAVVSDTSLASTDTTVTVVQDSLSKSTSGQYPSGTKNDKYNQHSTSGKEAPKHHSPNEAKLDSIKNAKAKKKQ